MRRSRDRHCFLNYSLDVLLNYQGRIIAAFFSHKLNTGSFVIYNKLRLSFRQSFFLTYYLIFSTFSMRGRSLPVTPSMVYYQLNLLIDTTSIDNTSNNAIFQCQYFSKVYHISECLQKSENRKPFLLRSESVEIDNEVLDCAE